MYTGDSILTIHSIPVTTGLAKETSHSGTIWWTGDDVLLDEEADDTDGVFSELPSSASSSSSSDMGGVSGSKSSSGGGVVHSMLSSSTNGVVVFANGPSGEYDGDFGESSSSTTMFAVGATGGHGDEGVRLHQESLNFRLGSKVKFQDEAASFQRFSPAFSSSVDRQTPPRLPAPPTAS